VLFDNIFQGAANIEVNQKNKLQTRKTIKAISKAIAEANKKSFQANLEKDFLGKDMEEELKHITLCKKS